jgi:hypothetical protein
MTSVLPLVLSLVQFAASEELGYRFNLPEGFVAFPEARSQRNVVDCWTETAPALPGGALVLCVQRMRGTIGQERMKPGDVPPASQLVTFKWKNFDLDGVRTDTAQGGSPMTVFAAQVPLRREAVQLIVAGPRDQSARAQAILASTLVTLEGETNWLTSTERAGRFGNIVGWVLGIGAGVLLMRIWRARQRSQAA